MTQSVGLYEDAPPDEAIRPPRLPTFEADDRTAEGRVEPLLDGFDRGRMGACLFVVADGVFFGGLFVVYATLYRSVPQVFSHGRYFLDVSSGAIGNFILLASGLMAALSVRAAKLGRTRSLTASIASTLCLAGLFLSVQAVEYSDMFQRRLLPGSHFLPTEPVWETPEFKREHPWAARYASRFRVSGRPAPAPGVSMTRMPASVERAREATTTALEPLFRVGALGDRAVYPEVPSEPRNAHVFFSLYFLFTGLHAIHVMGGVLGWAWLLFRVRRALPGSTQFGPVDGAALYWNLVAVLRVLMFPLFYLVH